jgi:hypothetical protein
MITSDYRAGLWCQPLQPGPQPFERNLSVVLPADGIKRGAGPRPRPAGRARRSSGPVPAQRAARRNDDAGAGRTHGCRALGEDRAYNDGCHDHLGRPGEDKSEQGQINRRWRDQVWRRRDPVAEGSAHQNGRDGEISERRAGVVRIEDTRRGGPGRWRSSSRCRPAMSTLTVTSRPQGIRVKAPSWSRRIARPAVDRGVSRPEFLIGCPLLGGATRRAPAKSPRRGSIRSAETQTASRSIVRPGSPRQRWRRSTRRTSGGDEERLPQPGEGGSETNFDGYGDGQAHTCAGDPPRVHGASKPSKRGTNCASTSPAPPRAARKRTR